MRGIETVSYTHLDVYKRQQLETFDFSKVTGEIAGEAFRDTGLKGALDLSRVTAIEVGAFENVTGVTDWSAICQGAEAGILKKLEYSNVFLKDDAVWDLVERAMDGKMCIRDSDDSCLHPHQPLV